MNWWQWALVGIGAAPFAVGVVYMWCMMCWLVWQVTQDAWEWLSE